MFHNHLLEIRCILLLFLISRKKQHNIIFIIKIKFKKELMIKSEVLAICL